MRKLLATAAIVGLVAIVAGPATGAGKSGSSISLVRMSSGLAAANDGPTFGEEVTFAVSTGRTAQPYVWNACYRNGERVYSETHGFFADYRYGQVFTLGPTHMWTGGAATCEAQLISLGNGQRFHVLASTSYSVVG